MAVYLITPLAKQITTFAKASDAQSSLDGISGSVLVKNPADLANVTTPMLIDIYNRAAREGEGKEITKFADRATAERRVWPCIEYLARPSIKMTQEAMPTPESTSPTDGAPAPTTTEETPVSDVKTPSKRAAAKKAPAAKKAAAKAPATKAVAKTAPAAKKAVVTNADGSAKRGRPSQLVGKTIYKLTEGGANPRREGTFGHKSFSLIRNGMRVEKFVEAGGRLKDLAWDIEHKNVELRND